MVPLGNLVGRVPLDGRDLAAREHGLHQPDVLVEDDEVAGPGLLPGAGRVGAAVALGPGVELVHGSEALALVAERRTGLVRYPRDEVSAPWSTRDRALRGGAVLGDARGVV